MRELSLLVLSYSGTEIGAHPTRGPCSHALRLHQDASLTAFETHGAIPGTIIIELTLP